MSRIKAKDTKPEMIVRSLLHNMGFRFRLHGLISKRIHPKGVLPGKPDIVLAKHKSVVFVHGCFWHQHPGCKQATMPKTRKDYWQDKLEKNVIRDAKAVSSLGILGYKVIIVWECETNIRDLSDLTNRLKMEILS